MDDIKIRFTAPDDMMTSIDENNPHDYNHHSILKTSQNPHHNKTYGYRGRCNRSTIDNTIYFFVAFMLIGECRLVRRSFAF